MRKKIWLIIVTFGLAAIWFTVNLNNINNLVKLKLTIYRAYKAKAARVLLAALSTSLQVITLSVHNPLIQPFSSITKLTSFLNITSVPDGRLFTAKRATITLQ